MEALFHKASGGRTSVVLAFDPSNVPAARVTAGGATLTAAVHAPQPSAEYTRVAWSPPGAKVAAPKLAAVTTVAMAEDEEEAELSRKVNEVLKGKGLRVPKTVPKAR